MNVHTGTVVTDQRLGHEGRCFPVSVSYVVNAVLQNLYFVRLGHEGVEANADLTLSGGAYFVVVYFNIETHLLHRSAHCGTNVME